MRMKEWIDSENKRITLKTANEKNKTKQKKLQMSPCCLMKKSTLS